MKKIVMMLVAMIVVASVIILGFTNAEDITQVDTTIVESGERSDCWYAGTIHGNNWENGTYEVILCPKTKEDYFMEYR